MKEISVSRFRTTTDGPSENNSAASAPKFTLCQRSLIGVSKLIGAQRSLVSLSRAPQSPPPQTQNKSVTIIPIPGTRRAAQGTHKACKAGRAWGMHRACTGHGQACKGTLRAHTGQGQGMHRAHSGRSHGMLSFFYQNQNLDFGKFFLILVKRDCGKKGMLMAHTGHTTRMDGACTGHVQGTHRVSSWHARGTDGARARKAQGVRERGGRGGGHALIGAGGGHSPRLGPSHTPRPSALRGGGHTGHTMRGVHCTRCALGESIWCRCRCRFVVLGSLWVRPGDAILWIDRNRFVPSPKSVPFSLSEGLRCASPRRLLWISGDDFTGVPVILYLALRQRQR